MMKAIVFAAGKGERLEPLTSTRPKHLIPVAGGPLVEHLLRALKGGGVSEVLVVVHFMGNRIKSVLGDGSRLGLSIKYAEQGGILGTGHALMKGESFVGKEQFIVAYGDLAVDPIAMRETIRSHSPKRFGTIAGVEVQDSREYGTLVLRGGKLKGIREKPRSGGPGVINAGVYILSPRIFEYLRDTGKSKRGEVELTDSITKAVAAGEAISVQRIGKGKWVDVGRPWNILEANELLMETAVSKGAVAGKVHRDANIIGRVVVEDGATVLPGAFIEGPAWVSSDCRVGPNCHIRPYTYLCRDVKVGNGCEVKASIILERSHIGHLSYVGDSVLGADCNLGAGTITANLRFDDLPVRVMIKGSSVVSGRRKLGAFLGDGVKTGINVSLFPGVKIGQQSWIGPHVALDSDVPERTLVTLKTALEIRQRR